MSRDTAGCKLQFGDKNVGKTLYVSLSWVSGMPHQHWPKSIRNKCVNMINVFILYTCPCGFDNTTLYISLLMYFCFMTQVEELRAFLKSKGAQISEECAEDSVEDVNQVIEGTDVLWREGKDGGSDLGMWNETWLTCAFLKLFIFLHRLFVWYNFWLLRHFDHFNLTD